MSNARWIPIAGYALLMMLLQGIGPQIFRYDSALIEQGQLWRWFSAHLVHANWIHLALNMAGFVLCAGITGVAWSFWQWTWRIILLAFFISAGFFLLQPKMGWYVGFSGVLMGLYLLAAAATFKQQPIISLLLAGFIMVKIIMEQVSSVNMTSSDLIGVPVMVDAHFYGVTVALVLIIIQRCYYYFYIRNRQV